MTYQYTYDAYHGAYCMPSWRYAYVEMPDGASDERAVRRCRRDAQRRGSEVNSVRRVVTVDGETRWQTIA